MEEKLFRRKLEDDVLKFLGRKEIIGIRGPRQTGKTTLLKMIQKEIPGTGNKAFINLDMLDYRKSLEENPLDFAKRFKKPGERLFLFLDEIQKVKNAGESLKIIFDENPDVKMFVTGSSSLELKTNVLPPLAGRIFLSELFTFDFEEFLSTRDESLRRLFSEKNKSLRGFLEGNDDISPPSFNDEFTKHWKEYCVFGGYPEVVKSGSVDERTTILKNIFNIYIEKDIASFFRIEDSSKFGDAVRMLAFGISNLLSVSSLASDLKVSHIKAEEFLAALQHTYITYLLKPFHRNLVTELKKSPKVYFLDLGLRNSVIGNFSPLDSRGDAGQIAENFVLRELVTGFAGWKLNYWRTTGKAEVDFILSRGKEVVPVEVKLSGNNMGRSFHSFLNSYEPERAIIACRDKFMKQKVGKTTVYWVPIYYF
jgi:hypothetical protein